MSLCTIFYALLSVVFCAFVGRSTERTISWWIDIGDTATNKANIQVIREHKDLFSRIQIDWTPGCTVDGDLSAWTEESHRVESWLSLYKPLKIPIIPVVICINNATIMHDTIYPNATNFALELIDIGTKFGFSGYIFDYEPEYPPDNDANSSYLYMEFLTTITNIFHENNLILLVNVADWSDALNNFGYLAESGCDELHDIETYYASSMEQEVEYMMEFLDDIIDDRQDFLSQAGVGLGCYKTDFWNPTMLNQVIQNMTQNGGYKIDIYRLDTQYDWPPQYWYQSLEMFMNGTL